jgi:hypothetical protein
MIAKGMSLLSNPQMFDNSIFDGECKYLLITCAAVGTSSVAFLGG